MYAISYDLVAKLIRIIETRKNMSVFKRKKKINSSKTTVLFCSYPDFFVTLHAILI